MYGPGGVGKTKLCSLIDQIGVRPYFVDVEGGSMRLNVKRAKPVPATFQEVRDILHDNNLWSQYDAVVIDSFTKLEELALRHVLDTVKTEGGKSCTSIEGYGYGKGFSYVYETFLQVLGDLDALHRAGKFILATAHECTANVPNPNGDDWIRYEPRLQSPASGKSSIRHKVKEWCDHLLFVGYDVAVNEDGKGRGGATRTIFPSERPTHWAKSRSGLTSPLVYNDGSPEIWQQLFPKE